MKKYLPIITSVLIINSCKTDNRQNDIICKKWKYHQMQVNGSVLNSKQLGEPIIQFYENGNYRLSYGPMSDTGKWELANNIITTTSVKDSLKQNASQQQSILKLTNDTFKVKYLGIETNMQLTMVPLERK